MHELWGIYFNIAENKVQVPWVNRPRKGNIFQNNQWSSSQWMDDRGVPQFAYYLDLGNGRQDKEDSSRFGDWQGMRAHCVRGPVK